MTATVSLVDVGVVLDGRPVLEHVTVDVARGEWLALVGPNGAGKTTLLRAVAGLVPATGDLVVDGCRPARTRRRTLARRVGYVPQNPEVPAGMSVREYALLGRTAHLPYFGVEGRHDYAVVDDVLATLDLSRFADRALATLSGGERQRAVLARALAQQAPVVLLDEPTSALDLGHQHGVLELVDDLRHRFGWTVLAAVHDLTLAAQYADRLLLLAGGRCHAVGPPAAVLTEELVTRHWHAPVRIIDDGAGGMAVLPVRHTRPLEVTHG